MMKRTKFTSCLAPQMEAFCTLHRHMGADYTSSSKRLHYFDKFLAREGFEGNFPTGDVIDRYLSGISDLKPQTQATYFSSIHQFCVYLKAFHPDCFIPQRFRFPQSSECFDPYIFTRDEIRALMAVAEQFVSRDPLRPATLKTLIGLLACTGLRISEALGLNFGDIFFDRLRLFIRKGKFRKERWVPISPSTCAVLKRYTVQRSAAWLTGKTYPLFISSRKQRISCAIARTSFRTILKQSGVYTGEGQAPRLHDLRHTFAVECLIRAYKEGKDPNSILPALATFMGHVNIRSTQLYLHTTPELWQEAYEGSLTYFRNHVSELPKQGGES